MRVGMSDLVHRFEKNDFSYFSLIIYSVASVGYKGLTQNSTQKVSRKITKHNKQFNVWNSLWLLTLNGELLFPLHNYIGDIKLQIKRYDN